MPDLSIFAPARRVLAPVLLLLGLAACAGRAAPQTAGPQCLGQIRLTITNDWNQPLEVHRAGMVGAGPTLIGQMAPGARQEFLLPPGVRSVYTLWLDGTIAKPIPRQFRRMVRFRYECDPVR